MMTCRSSVAGGCGIGGGEVASSFAFVDDNHDNESDDTVVVVVP